MSSPRPLDAASRVRASHAPVVCVLDEREVDRRTDGSGFSEDASTSELKSLVSLFRAVSSVKGLNETLRCDGERASKVTIVRELRARFVSEDGATSGTRADAEASGTAACEKECFNAQAMNERAVMDAREESLDDCVRRAREEATTSGRFNGYFDANARALTFNECEAFDHPVGAILCARVRERTAEDVVRVFEDLKGRFRRLPVFGTGAGDPEACFGMALVWDARGGTSRERAEELLKNVQRAGAPDCELLIVNSDESGSFASGVSWSEHAETIIARAAIEHSGASALSADEGKYMSSDDVERARAYVRSFVTRTLIPHIERKLFALSTQIYNTRKGFKNQFKSFWGRSTTTASRPEAERGYRSPESQIRLAGDLAFGIGDYETALAHYKLVQSDYKSQNAWKPLASSYEAMAHVYLMTRHTRNTVDVKKEIDHAYDSAMLALSKYELSGGHSEIHRMHVEMLKTRSAIEHAEALQLIGAYRDAHAPLVVISAFDDSELRAALLLERAAFAFVRCEPPMLRKFASYMVLAGVRYVRAGAIAAATRCYAYALPATSDHGWNAAKEHLNTTLGQLVARVGYTRASLEFFRDAVKHASHLTDDEQRVRLSSLEEYAGKYEKETPAEKRDAMADELACPLPGMNIKNVHVTFADDRESSESSADNGEEAWEAIERGGVVPQNLLSGATGANWLNNGGRKIEIDQTAVCASGEDVKVDVEFTNPLRLPLDMKNLRLLWEFTPSLGEMMTNEGGSESIGSLVEAKVEEVTLAPESTREIRLSITPHSSGILRVRGVAWTVGTTGFLRGRRHFDVAAPRTRRGPNGEWLRDVPKHKRLIFNVCETMPRCEATLEGVPAQALDGELRRIDLIISNVTQPMAKWIRVRLPKSVLRPVDVSHVPLGEPAIHRNASHDDFVRGATGGGNSEDNLLDGDGAVYALSEWENLGSGSPIRWPLWFHPRAVGRATVRICVCYQPEPPAPKLLTHRTIRIFERVDVAPSFSARASSMPSPSHPLARVVRLSLKSASTQTKVFDIESVRLGSRKDGVKYNLVPLVKDASASRVIRPGETIETLLKCSPTSDTSASELFDFPSAILAERATSLFAFHDSDRGQATMKHFAKGRGDIITNGLMVTWSTRDGALVGAQHIRDVVELSRCADTARTPFSQRSEVFWTIDYPSIIKMRQNSSFTQSNVVLKARNESDEMLDIEFVADATRSAPANVENGGWSLDKDENAWQNRETSFPSDDQVRRRPIPLPPGKPFIWVGPVRRVARNVAPGQVFEFPLTIACFAKGDHILDGYTLSWSTSLKHLTVNTMTASPRAGREHSAPRVADPADAPGAPHVFTVV